VTPGDVHERACDPDAKGLTPRGATSRWVNAREVSKSDRVNQSAELKVVPVTSKTLRGKILSELNNKVPSNPISVATRRRKNDVEAGIYTWGRRVTRLQTRPTIDPRLPKFVSHFACSEDDRSRVRMNLENRMRNSFPSSPSVS
jgi:hypothetical protein